MRILLLPFAVFEQGDEAAAKLARQIPRMIGMELERAASVHGLNARYLSSRGTAASGEAGLVATTELPSPSELGNTAEMYGADFVLSGRFGLSDKNLLLEARLFNREQKRESYAKRFETYPSYYFDAVEEIKTRMVQSAGITLSDTERIELFRRPTESWQAYLYYLFAEDDRYGLSIGIKPKDAMAPISYYREALQIDPTFANAMNSLQLYIITLIENELIDEAKIKSLIEEFRTILPAEFIGALEDVLS